MADDGWRLAAALLVLLAGLGSGALWPVGAHHRWRGLAWDRVPWAGRLVVGLVATALGALLDVGLQALSVGRADWRTAALHGLAFGVGWLFAWAALARARRSR